MSYYQGRIAVTVYKVTKKDNVVERSVSDNDFQFSTDKPILYSCSSSGEVIDQFLKEYKNWNLSCEGEQGEKELVAKSMTMVEFCPPSGCPVLAYAYPEQIIKLGEGQYIYDVEARLSIVEIIEKPYDVEEYLNQYKG